MDNEFFNFDVVVKIEKQKSYNKALDDMVNAIVNSDNALLYACNDNDCLMDNCKKCKNRLREELQEIAEQLKEQKNGKVY